MWAEILEAMEHSYYIEGVAISSYGDHEWYDETIHSVVLNSAQVTDRGLEFLEENISWKQTYSGIAGVNEWLEL